MESKKSSPFGIGVIIGFIGGFIAGLFLSPRSGKENRELFLKQIHDLQTNLASLETEKKLKELFLMINKDAVDLYKSTKALMLSKLAEAEESLENFDREQYTKIVQEVIEEVKKETKIAEEELKKVKEYLIEKWKG